MSHLNVRAPSMLLSVIAIVRPCSCQHILWALNVFQPMQKVFNSDAASVLRSKVSEHMYFVSKLHGLKLIESSPIYNVFCSSIILL